MAYKAKFDETRGFGVEIEICGFELYNLRASDIDKKLRAIKRGNSWWKVINDASIQGDMPLEIISPILYGNNGLSEVVEVMSLLNALECRTNSSCGFHVHWGVPDYTGDNVLSLLKFYTKYEQIIDKIVNEDRRENNCLHATSLRKLNDLSWIDELAEKNSEIAANTASNFTKKYYSERCKVNVKSVLKYGTIEFRQHHATLCADEAVNWIVLTQLMVNKAKASRISNSTENCTIQTLIRSLGISQVDPELARYFREKYRKNLIDDKREISS